MTASIPKTFRLVHLLDNRNPAVPAGRPVYTVCGLVVPALEPGDEHRPDFEAVRNPAAVTCIECRRGPTGYKWFRATTRRAAAEAKPRAPFLGLFWYPLGPWLQGRLLGRIGRGRWKLRPNW